MNNEMKNSDLKTKLTFIQAAERLKSVLRSGKTSLGRKESTAEHTWRLCLFAMVLEDELKAFDLLKILKICIIHDLGEALNGDVPAIEKKNKSINKRTEYADLMSLLSVLPDKQKEEISSLWLDYEEGRTPEAQIVKALDKLETIVQHNQVDQGKEFNYEFNLNYGEQYTHAHPCIEILRAFINEDTLQRSNHAK